MFNKVTVTFISVILLFLVINESQCFLLSKPRKLSRHKGYNLEIDQFKISQQWPPAACMAINKQKPSDNYCQLPKSHNWTLHGLWIEGPENKHLIDCGHEKYQPSLLESEVREEMKAKWPTYKLKSNNEDFWAHEFEKHGTCAMAHPEIKTMTDYFSKALELLNQYNVAKVFDNENILLSENEYQLGEIQQSMRNHFKVEVQLECYIPKHSSVQYLYEVGICFDTSFRLVNCKRNLVNCSKKKKIIHLT